MTPLRVALLLTVAGTLATAVPAVATVTPGSAGGTQVFLESDGAGDTMSLTCKSGQVHYPGPPTAVDLLPCADTQSIDITGNAGNDSVDLSGLTRADFPKLNRVLIRLGDTGDADTVKGTQMKDTITADSQDSVTANGGGDDITNGGIILGGDGDDVIKNPAGTVDGGNGDDRISAPTSTGPFGGGAGNDVFVFDLPADAPLPGTTGFGLTDTALTISGVGPADIVLGLSSLERIELSLLNAGTQTLDASTFSGTLVADGRDGPDVLIGGPGEDFLFGGGGDDQITGGPGFDFVDAGSGADALFLRDGETDRARCGEDADSVVADRPDVLTDCESADLPAEPAPGETPVVPPDTVAPVLTLSGATLAGRAVRFTAGCPAGESRCMGVATLKVKGRRGGKRVTRALGRLPFSIAGGAEAVAAQPLGRKLGKAVGRIRGPRLLLALDVFDAAGNRAVQKASLEVAKGS